MSRMLIVSLIALVCGVTAAPVVFAQSEDRTPQKRQASATWKLDSQEPYQAVHVPFTLRNSYIVVKAKLEGRSVECVIDTGYNGIAWNGSLNLPCQNRGVASGSGRGGGGNEMPMKLCVLDSVQIGGYSLQAVRGYCTDPGTQKNPTDYNFGETPLLGLETFKDVVLTIDYARRELILRNSTYNTSRQPHSKQALALDMQPVSNFPLEYGVPTVAGTLANVPARLLLDTGWNISEIAMIQTFWDAHKALQSQLSVGGPLQEMKRSFLGGEATVTRIPVVEVGLGAGPIVSTPRPALVTFPFLPQMDGIIGGNILQYYCVTFDCPHKRVVMEPYDAAYQAKLWRGEQSVSPATTITSTSTAANGVTYTVTTTIINGVAHTTTKTTPPMSSNGAEAGTGTSKP